MRRTSGWAAAALVIAGAVGAAVTAEDRPAQPQPPAQPGQPAPKPPAAPGGGPAAVAGPAAAADPAPAARAKPPEIKIDPKVAALIADLGSDDYRTREKAGASLAAMAEKALPAMRASLLSTDSPEVQRRLAVLVKKMDTERLVSAKRVTMNLKQATVKAGLDEIGKQTGYKIEYSGNGGAEPRHNFEFDNVSFWVAIDKIAGAGGGMVVGDYDDDVVRVYNQDAVNPHVAYSGPFRFLATNIHSNKSVQLSGLSRRGGNNRSESMSLNFQIQSEPKNPMLGVTQAEVISAVDDEGASLVPPKDPNNRSNYYENRGMRGHNTYGNLNLTRTGASTATTIKSLKGKIGIILLAGVAPEIIVTDPLKAKAKTYVGRTVEMDFATFAEDANNKGQYTLDVTLKKLGVEDPDRQDYNWSNGIWNKIDVFDAAGNKYQNFGPNNINNNGAAIQITIPFGPTERRTGKQLKLGPPVKVVVQEWLSVTHEVTFEFKDIPLP